MLRDNNENQCLKLIHVVFMKKELALQKAENQFKERFLPCIINIMTIH